VRLPEGLTPRSVHLLEAGTTPKVEAVGGVVSLTVPSVRVHEVVAIDL
jgi:hypothetical protein